jgi:membrane protease YdiL (CAAX protease family)
VTRARALAVSEILLCSGVPSQVVIANLIVLAGVPPPAEHPTLAFIAAVLLLDTIVVVTLMVLLTRARGQSIRAVWLGPRPWTREAMLGIVLVPVVFGIVIALLTVLRQAAPGLHSVPVNPLEQLARQGLYQSVLFGFVAIVGGGVREELQRAFMLQRFEEHLGGGGLGVVVLSVAFGLGHVDQGWDAVVTTGFIGAFWAVLYRRRRSTIAPMVSHAGFNGLEVLRAALLRG